MEVYFCTLTTLDKWEGIQTWKDAVFIPRKGETVFLLGKRYMVEQLQWSNPTMISIWVKPLVD